MDTADHSEKGLASEAGKFHTNIFRAEIKNETQIV
jgi:hypothetical protein